jgi:hypothetical protein
MNNKTTYKLFKFSSNPQDKVIFSHAIGEKYIVNFFKNSFDFIKDYCIKHNIDFILFIDYGNSHYNIYWQKCFYPKTLFELGYKKACYIDTDIVISPFAPNIFSVWDCKKFGVISSVKNLPYSVSYLEIKSRAARLRNSIDNNYPLISSLTAPYEDIYHYHDIFNLNDSITTGLFLFNTIDYKEFEQIAEKYGKNNAIDNGEEIYLNILFNNTETHFLDYKFQAIWLYEMAHLYPFLYNKKDESMIIECFTASLFNNYFLHFAGSWESWVWHLSSKVYDRLNNFSEIYSEVLIPHKILNSQYRPLNK